LEYRWRHSWGSRSYRLASLAVREDKRVSMRSQSDLEQSLMIHVGLQLILHLLMERGQIQFMKPTLLTESMLVHVETPRVEISAAFQTQQTLLCAIFPHPIISLPRLRRRPHFCPCRRPLCRPLVPPSSSARYSAVRRCSLSSFARSSAARSLRLKNSISFASWWDISCLATVRDCCYNCGELTLLTINEEPPRPRPLRRQLHRHTVSLGRDEWWQK